MKADRGTPQPRGGDLKNQKTAQADAQRLVAGRPALRKTLDYDRQGTRRLDRGR